MTGPAFVDLETTGLSPWPTHEPWEVGLIVDADEYLWQLPVSVGDADPAAFNMNGWWTRRWPDAHDDPDRDSALDGSVSPDGTGHVVHPDDMALWARRFTSLTVGRGLVADNVGFDKNDHLNGLLRAHNACPSVHHRGVDTESILFGYIHRALNDDPSLVDKIPAKALTVPWSHGALVEALNTIAGTALVIDGSDRHSALGDARLVRTAFLIVTGGRL